ncbi:MAG: hypothetical protein K6T55_10095 [Syntrophobacterales bacterium]|nr:hypothetical protein [Syntrophobacterales bacterium]
MARLRIASMVVVMFLWGLSGPWAATDPPAETRPPAEETLPESGSPRLSTPFYLFRECPRQVWLERVYLLVTGPEEEKLARDLEQPSLRAAIYDALQRNADNLEEEVRRELKRLVGEEASRRVGLSRAFLLGP